MEQALRDVAILVVSLAMAVGPVAVLIGLLNRRDRREAALFNAACGAFSAQALRSDVVVGVRCGLWSRRSVVTVDLHACAPAEFWEAVTRLRQGLPASARLQLDGTMGPTPFRTRLTVERVDAPAELVRASVGSIAA
jgi:hypothetical protein